MLENFERFVIERLPPDARAEFHRGGAAPGFSLSPDAPFLRAAQAALAAEFSKPAALIGSGASIPVVEAFKTHLGLDTLLAGFGLDDDCIHSPNEKFELACFHRGTRAHARLLAAFAGQLLADRVLDHLHRPAGDQRHVKAHLLARPFRAHGQRHTGGRQQPCLLPGGDGIGGFRKARPRLYLDKDQAPRIRRNEIDLSGLGPQPLCQDGVSGGQQLFRHQILGTAAQRLRGPAPGECVERG